MATLDTGVDWTVRPMDGDGFGVGCRLDPGVGKKMVVQTYVRQCR